jgi:Xaa-Pro aminopeptidase
MEVVNMETMQPVLKRGRDVWDKINMPKTEFQQRVDKIRKQMQKENIDILLVYGHGQNDYGNPCYISNYLMKTLRGIIVVITGKGEVTLFIRMAEREAVAAKLTTWVEDIRPCGDVAKECVIYLKENNLIPSTVGYVGVNQFMPNYQLQFVSKSLEQCNVVDADHILSDMRMLKSKRECDQIRRSSRIVCHAFSIIPEYHFPDKNEMVLEALIDREARMEGAEDVRILFAKPNDTKWAFRPPEDLQISPGDTVIIYLAIEFERYWSEGIRTFGIEDSSLMEIKPDVTMTTYRKIMGGMKAGKKMSELYKETVVQLEEDSFDYIPEYGFGQGIGLSLNELPTIAAEDTNYLKGGMFLTLYLAMRDRKLGAVIVGNTIHVKKHGLEILTE